MNRPSPAQPPALLVVFAIIAAVVMIGGAFIAGLIVWLHVGGS